MACLARRDGSRMSGRGVAPDDRGAQPRDRYMAVVMDHAAPPILVAADGGGSACRVAMVVHGRRHDLRVGAANVHSDPEGAVETLRAALAELAAQAEIDAAALAGAVGYFGLAGANAPAAAARIAAHLPLRRVRVEDDRRAAVAGAFGDRDGTLAGIGTGSFLARQKAGAIDLRGGWGFVLGDEASGGWLGRLALARVLHVVDGIAPDSDLTRALAKRFGGPQGILDFVAAARPGDMAALAPDVVAAAAAGDAAGRALMQAGADYIARAAAAIGWCAPEPFCLTGGLGSAYGPCLPAELAAALCPPAASAIDGALALAARFAAEPAP